MLLQLWSPFNIVYAAHTAEGAEAILLGMVVEMAVRCFVLL